MPPAGIGNAWKRVSGNRGVSGNRVRSKPEPRCLKKGRAGGEKKQNLPLYQIKETTRQVLEKLLVPKGLLPL